MTNNKPTQAQIEAAAKAIARVFAKQWDDEITMGGDEAINKMVERDWKENKEEARAALIAALNVEEK